MRTRAERIEKCGELEGERGRGRGARGRERAGELCEGTVGRVGCGGLQLEGEGRPLQCGICLMGEGRGGEDIGLCCSCIGSPPPPFPRSQSSAGKSVFVYLLLLKM